MHISCVAVEGEQYDQAVSLAEKYCDFRTLVEVCDRTNNQERLTQYMNRFGSEVSPGHGLREDWISTLGNSSLLGFQIGLNEVIFFSP